MISFETHMRKNSHTDENLQSVNTLSWLIKMSDDENTAWILRSTSDWDHCWPRQKEREPSDMLGFYTVPWRSDCFPWTLKWNIKPQVNIECKEHFPRQILRERQTKSTALLRIPLTHYCGAGRNGFPVGTPRSSGSSIRWLRLWSAGLRVHHSMNSEDKIWNSVFSNWDKYWKYCLESFF